MRLLVSIATVREIGPALGGGTQILDVKNPALGSLGAADPEVVQVARLVAPGEVPVSAALGDSILPGGGCAGVEQVAELAVELACRGAAILKIGLAGVGAGEGVKALIRLRERLWHTRAPRVGLVAVAFADGAGEACVLPEELPRVALEAGVEGAMLDTLLKGRSIFEILGEAVLARLVEAVRGRGLLCGLAGSLSIEDAARAAALGADVVGLRGSVCVGGRGGRVVAARVRRARAALDAVAAGELGTRMEGARLEMARGMVFEARVR